MIALQYPAGLHFCVTRPNTAPGLAEQFVAALREAVTYATEHKGKRSKSGAVYGFGTYQLAQDMVKFTMVRVLDAFHETAPEPDGAAVSPAP
jgi:hypothetical protein